MHQILSFFKKTFSFLLNKWKIILSLALLSAGIGFCIALTNDEKYTASLSFVLEDEKNSSPISGAIGLASQFGIDVGGGGGALFSGANVLELFKSRMILRKVLEVKNPMTGKSIMYSYLNLYHEPLFKRYLKLENNFSSIENTQYIKDSIISVIHNHILKNLLFVDQGDKKNSIFIIKVVSKDENFSKIFVETIVDAVSQFYVETKSKKARLNLEILQRQVDSVRLQLNNSFLGVATTSDKIYNLNPALTTQRVPTTKMQFDQQANAAILTELVKNLELAKVTLRKETPLFQIIDKPIPPLPKTGRGRVKNTAIGFLFGLFIASMFFIVKITIPDLTKEN